MIEQTVRDVENFTKTNNVNEGGGSDVEAGKRAGCHSYLFDGHDLSRLARQIIATHFRPNGKQS